MVGRYFLSHNLQIQCFMLQAASKLKILTYTKFINNKIRYLSTAPEMFSIFSLSFFFSLSIFFFSLSLSLSIFSQSLPKLDLLRNFHMCLHLHRYANVVTWLCAKSLNVLSYALMYLTMRYCTDALMYLKCGNALTFALIYLQMR